MTRDEALAALTGPGAPFEQVELEVGGVPTTVFASAPPSLRDLLVSGRAHGERDFLVFADERYTFEDHFGIVAGLARWMADEHGVGKGDRVAIGMRNYPQWVMAFWAAQALGAVAVTLNAWWTAPELRYALEDSGARLVVVDGEREERMAEMLDELGLPSLVVRPTGDLRPGASSWDDVFARLDLSPVLPEVEIDPDDPATIIYTSGTTGLPKGALASQRNHVSNFLAVALGGAVDRMTSPPPDVPPPDPLPPASLQTYPFFHIGGLSMIYLATGFGQKVVLQYRWDLVEALDLIEREQITSMAAVPTILRQILDAPDLDSRDLSSLATLGSGGAPVPPDLVPRAEERFGAKVSSSNGYGLTETTGGATGNRGADYVARPSSVGRPMVGMRLQVVDPGTGAVLPEGQIGELWFQGATIVSGYWNKPEATAEAFTDGWFHTGDLGYVDDEGFVYVVDRLKDVVIRGGENVYCAEVEAVLFEHPAVGDVAVIGMPHRELGEQVAAVVEPRPGVGVTADELQDHVRGRLAHFKVPEIVVFRDEPLPRTATGKVLKRDLRDELTQGG
jgi:long-chain acyl-CoA synthetase